MRALHRVTAALLVGGLGTRLRPAVPHGPKVLAPVGGRPYVTYLLDQLAAVAVPEVVLLAGYRAEDLRAALGDWYGDLRLVYSVEPEPLGTGGALRWALDELFSPTILLLNGDSFCAVDLRAFGQFHADHAAVASLVLTEVDDATRFGRVRVDDDQRVERWEEKGRAGPGWINAGVYLLDRSLIEPIPPGVPQSLERDLFPQWIAGGRVFGFPADGGFIDMGTPESYAQAGAFFQSFA